MTSWVRFFLGVLATGCSSQGQSPSVVAQPTHQRVEEASSPELEEATRCKRAHPRSRLPSGCPPEYGEDAWGHYLAVQTDIFASLSVAKDCLNDIGPSGEAPFVPPLSALCHLGPDKKCVLVPDGTPPKEVWEYNIPSRQESPEWYVFEVGGEMRRLADATHTRFGWERKGDICEVWVEGIADFNGDGIYSRELRGEEFDLATGDFVRKTREVIEFENPAKRRPGASEPNAANPVIPAVNDHD